MSKKTKTMLLTLGVLAVLGAVLAGVLLLHRSNEEKDAAQQDLEENGIVIDTNDKDKIVSFSYTNKDPGYENGTFVFEKNGDKWIYAGDREFPLTQDLVQAKVDVLEKVYARRVVEESCQDLGKYGLDDPVMTVAFTDGSHDKTYYIGDYNASAQGYYMYMDGSETVYMVDGTLWGTYSVELYDMAAIPSYPSLSSDHFTHVTFEIKGGDTLDFYFERDPDTGETPKPYENGKKTITGKWYILDKDGNKTAANASRASILMSSLVDLEYVREVTYHATEEDRETFGLTDPAVKITIVYTEDVMDENTISQTQVEDNLSETQWDTREEEKTVVINIGDMTDSYTYSDDYYVQLDGMKEVVTLDESTVEIFSRLKLVDYIAGK